MKVSNALILKGQINALLQYSWQLEETLHMLSCHLLKPLS